MANEREVMNNIADIHFRKKLAIKALCKFYAARVIQDFKKEQSQDKYWTNQSGFAKDLMFAEEFEEEQVIGFFMAHGVEYGPSLELANDKQHAAIVPTINKFLPQFRKDLQRIW